MKYPDDYIDKVICGDCLDVMKGIPDNAVDLVLTDPPYGVDKAGWDNFIGLKWFNCILDKFRNLAFTSGHKFMYKYPEPDCVMSVVRAGSVQLQKKGGGFSHWEPMLVYGDKLPNPDMVQIPANTNAKQFGHPCAKSLLLYTWVISKLTNENDLILDPFLGSGTTAVACRQLNRHFIGIEINPDYCKIARERLMGTSESLFGDARKKRA